MKTIGFIYRGIQQSGLYGAVEAENQLLRAISLYSNWDRIVVWTSVKNTLGLQDERVIIRDFTNIIEDLREFLVDCIHHVGLGASTLAGLRSISSAPVVTSVFPALSYHHQILDHFFEISTPKIPGDISIYPSNCSQEAVKRIYSTLTGYDSTAQHPSYKVIPIGVDAEVFCRADSSTRCRTRELESIQQNAVVGVIISRFSPSDKADLLPLIRSIASNQSVKDSNLHFLLVGGDTYFGSKQYIDMLQKEISELGLTKIVQIKSINDRTQLIDVLKCADIFISPADSVQETFGITPIEAMSCGLPAIVSDWNGYRETVVHGETGFLVKTTFFNNSEIWESVGYNAHFREQHLVIGQSVVVNTDEIIRHCLTLSDNPIVLAQMKARAEEVTKENFSWRAVIRKYEQVWADLQPPPRSFEMMPARRIDYWSCFNHYATCRGSDEQTFEITSFGLDILHGRKSLRIIAGLESFLPIKMIKLILISLSKNPCSIESFDKLHDASKPSIRFVL